jgi:hypothetical protein
MRGGWASERNSRPAPEKLIEELLEQGVVPGLTWRGDTRASGSRAGSS